MREEFGSVDLVLKNDPSTGHDVGTHGFRSRKLSEIFICGMMKPEMNEPEPIELPINGVLDLHTFRPADVKTLVPDYLDECRKRGIYHIRIPHETLSTKRALGRTFLLWNRLLITLYALPTNR